MFFYIKANTTYTMSYYVKTDSPDYVFGNPGVWEQDSNGNLIQQQYRYLPLSPGWQRIEFSFTSSPDTVRIYLNATLYQRYNETVENEKEGVFYTIWIDGVQFEESATASPFQINFITCPQVMLATVDLKPDTLELKSEGERITCFIELPQGYNVAEIDVSTVLMDNTIYAELEPTRIGDYDGDLVTDLMVKFDRQAVINYLKGKGVNDGDIVKLTVKANLNDGTSFEGSDTIRVINTY